MEGVIFPGRPALQNSGDISILSEEMEKAKSYTPQSGREGLGGGGQQSEEVAGVTLKGKRGRTRTQ